MGSRKRYRVIDLERLCWHLRADNVEEVRKNLIASLAERIARDEVKREPCWTESLAVGSLGFVEKVIEQGRFTFHFRTTVIGRRQI